MNTASTRKHTVAVVLSTLLVVSGVTGGVVAVDGDTVRAASPADCDASCVSQSAQFDPTGARNHSSVIGPNLGAALSLRHEALDSQLQTLAYRDRLATADNETAVLTMEFETLRAQADELAEREATALDNYDRRNSTAEELLVDLVHIDAAARRLDERRVAATARLTDLTVVGVNTRTLRADLLAREGPVRHHSLQRLTGAIPAGPVDIQASSEYVALATTSQQASVLERYQSDYRDRPSTGPATIEAAGELVAAHYPAEWSNRTGYTIRQLDADLLYVELEHTGGTVVAYIDRPSARVFKEFQYMPLPAAGGRSSGGFVMTDLQDER